MRAAGLPGPPVCGYRMPHRDTNRNKTGIRAVMRVWIDPADQSRHYVPEPGA